MTDQSTSGDKPMNDEGSPSVSQASTSSTSSPRKSWTVVADEEVDLNTSDIPLVKEEDTSDADSDKEISAPPLRKLRLVKRTVPASDDISQPKEAFIAVLYSCGGLELTKNCTVEDIASVGLVPGDDDNASDDETDHSPKVPKVSSDDEESSQRRTRARDLISISFGPFKGKITAEDAAILSHCKSCVICVMIKNGVQVLYKDLDDGRVNCTDMCEMVFWMNEDIVSRRMARITPPTQLQKSSFNGMISYILHEHDKRYPASICEICFKVCSTASGLSRHRRIHLNNESNHVCDNCEEKFVDDVTLQLHQKSQMCIHKEPKKDIYPCPICDKEFAFKNSLRDHLPVHTGEKPHVCEVCNKGFIRRDTLMNHIRTHTGEKPYVCKVCDRPFSSRGGLRVHARLHTGDKPYECERCLKRFTTSGNMKIHMRQHTGEKAPALHKCDQCEKAFPSASALKMHKQLHTGIKPYACSVCGKQFYQAGGLKRHEMTHTGEKPYSCPICNKTFTGASSMRNHTRIHTGERPYKCDICGKTFTFRVAYSSHIQNVHSGIKPYQCSSCLKAFPNKYKLKVHSRTHTGEKPYPCSECDMSFAERGNLKKHMRVHTGEKPYICQKCGQDFASSCSLKVHMNKHDNATVTHQPYSSQGDKGISQATVTQGIPASQGLPPLPTTSMTL